MFRILIAKVLNGKGSREATQSLRVSFFSFLVGPSSVGPFGWMNCHKRLP